MAGILQKILSGKKQKMSDSGRFLRRGKNTCRQTPAGGRKCPTKSGGKQSSAATYLTFPNLRGVQEVITDKMDCSLPETLLTLLHRIYPLDEVLKNSNNPVDFLKKLIEQPCLILRWKHQIIRV